MREAVGDRGVDRRRAVAGGAARVSTACVRFGPTRFGVGRPVADRLSKRGIGGIVAGFRFVQEGAMARVHVIYNPVACQGRAGARLPEVERRLTAAGVDYRIHQTEWPGHAVELARKVARSGEADVVVAAGGDGTANEVINGLMLARMAGRAALAPGADLNMPALGVLSVGRGNDFAYGAGIPTELEGCVECLAADRRGALDVGFLRGGEYPEGRYFGNGIGIGFDTIVGLEAAKMTWIKGFVCYIVAALKTLLFFYKAPQVVITHDNGTLWIPCMQLSIMNGRRMGGSFFMAPKAEAGDGLFDLCIVNKPRRGRMLGLLLAFMKGTQGRSKHVTVGRTARIQVEALSGVLPIHADGETMAVAGKKLEVEVIPAALTVVTNAPVAAGAFASESAVEAQRH